MGFVAPFTLAVIIGLLVNLLGAFALVGLGIFILLFPINGFIAKKFTALRRAVLVQTDKRVQLENELFTSMRAVKFYAWEKAMFGVCSDVRDQELVEVRSMSLWRAVLVSSFMICCSRRCSSLDTHTHTYTHT